MVKNEVQGGDAGLSSPTNLGGPIEVGGLKIANRSFLAPMSGVTDKAFRNLAWRFGAGLVFSEMVASEALVGGEAEMALKALPGYGPIHAVQLAGREPKWMRLAAQMAEANGADLIDINMGCPAKRVTTGMSGSALMREPDLALQLIEAVVVAVSVPVSVEMRLGWDDQSHNAAFLARSAQNAGARMITVHGRTRCQFYNGKANWPAISAVREAIDIPLVVNGDIVDKHTAAKAVAASRADAVMTGRASYGAPWLAGIIGSSHMAPSLIDPEFIARIAVEHYLELLSLYGKQSGLRQARKHLGWYLDGMGIAATAPLRQFILTSGNPDEVVSAMQRAGQMGGAQTHPDPYTISAVAA